MLQRSTASSTGSRHPRELPPGDGAGVFNRMYLDVTERVAAALQRARSSDAGFMAEFDVRFAHLWLTAYDAVAGGRKPPSAWKPLFEEPGTPGVLPIQFALAGMNAHIEHDLPLAVVETCRARHTARSHRGPRGLRGGQRRARRASSPGSAAPSSPRSASRWTRTSGRSSPGQRLEHRQGPRPGLGQRRDPVGAALARAAPRPVRRDARRTPSAWAHGCCSTPVALVIEAEALPARARPPRAAGVFWSST